MKEKPPNYYFKLILILVTAVVVSGLLFYVSTLSSEFTFNSPFNFLESNKKISVLVVGDIMLDRNVRNRINKIGFDAFFGGIKELISDVDIAVGNLEGPFTTYESLTANSKNKTLTFTFDPLLAPKLAEIGFDILGLANNHTLNFGKEGLISTKKYTKEAGMLYYGDPNNTDEISTIIEKNDLKIGFIGFHEFSYINFDKVLVKISRLRPDVDVLIVTPHWGTEYKKEPTTNMSKWAHQFIDLGADAVIGTHPHIVADIEEYKNKKIFYSLGNFAFDQYFSEETMEGLAVKIDIEKESNRRNSKKDNGEKNKIELNYSLIPIRIDREGTRISSNQHEI